MGKLPIFQYSIWEMNVINVYGKVYIFINLITTFFRSYNFDHSTVTFELVFQLHRPDEFHAFNMKRQGETSRCWQYITHSTGFCRTK